MNPELTHWTGPHGLPRFDLIADSDFAEVIEAQLKRGAAAVEAIAASPAPAGFANTVAALEVADEPLDRACAIFYTLSSVASNPVREALERDLAPRLAGYSNTVMMDPRLIARVQAVSEQAADLPAQDRRITELQLRARRRSGAGLAPDDRAALAAINERLATLTTQFSQNVLTDERDYALAIPDDRLAGLPDWLLGAMRAAARERGLTGQIVTLSRSLIVPFLELSQDRALRETAFRAWVARGSGRGAGGAATDNTAIVTEILSLRHQAARLLGYDDFAAFRLEPEMARDAGRVEDLLMQVWHPALTRARADQQVLTQMLIADGGNGPLEPWDWRFYAARRKQAEHDFDPDALKPYLTLEAMIGAVFDTAHRLFGLDFVPFDAPLWHGDVRAWQISRDGQPMAVFLGDYFARPGKHSGAWCSTLQGQHKIGAGQRPIVINVCNFTPPDQTGGPAFLSWDDARTLFHEFGHALHHILSDVDWPSIAGTSVALDFVELPSQLYEHWLEQPQLLKQHARHYQTGAPLPPELLDRLSAADKADAGFSTVEYLESALVDLAFHRGDAPADPAARQSQVLAALDAPPAIPLRHDTPHFSHVFSGGHYASGYYSYMWSEVMDADAFAAFEEQGDIFDPATARRLEQTILSRGGSAPADDLWIAFRERMPGVGPLLKGRGLI